MWSTSAWGRGMTWTEISSPTFSAAAALAVGGRLHRAHVAPHHDGHQAAAHLLLAHQLHVGGFHHGVGRLDGAHQSFCLHHTQCVCIGHITVPPVSRLFGLFRFRLRLRWGRRLWFLRFSRPGGLPGWGGRVLRRVAAGARPLWAGAARAADTGVCGTPPTAPAGSPLPAYTVWALSSSIPSGSSAVRELVRACTSCNSASCGLRSTPSALTSLIRSASL